jgi:hypothetical protein
MPITERASFELKNILTRQVCEVRVGLFNSLEPYRPSPMPVGFEFISPAFSTVGGYWGFRGATIPW